MNSKKAVFFFCNDLKKDPVANNVIKCCEEIMDLRQTDIVEIQIQDILKTCNITISRINF
ncbi:hypothetical protein IR152_15220 [Clostridioides sp. ES-S-0108-01]|nr:hypothetical protein [Clostridioides sp. ES-S-0108-01]